MAERATRRLSDRVDCMIELFSASDKVVPPSRRLSLDVSPAGATRLGPSSFALIPAQSNPVPGSKTTEYCLKAQPMQVGSRLQ